MAKTTTKNGTSLEASMTSCRRRNKSSVLAVATVAAMVAAAGCGVETSSEMGAGGKSLIAVDDCRDGDCARSQVDSQEIIASPSNATPCTMPGECPSGFCVDNVCCDKKCTGTCQACSAAKKGAGADGICGNIANGLNPDNECTGTCNGLGSCTKSGILLGNGSSCSMGSQCSSSVCVDGVCCNSSCTGTCQACSAAKKGSGADGICGNIATTTDPDNECPTDNCNGAGECAPPGTSPSGAACSSGGTCLSGYCVDGVCCTSACIGTCQACSAAKKATGANGICGIIAPATDPDNDCLFGTCNSFGDCGPALLLGNSAACSNAGQCSSGFCVDGVCCSSACTGNCDACNVPGSQGACSNSCAATLCPNGFGLPDWPVLPLDGVSTIYWNGNTMPFFLADMNNDGRSDFVSQWGSTYPFWTFLNLGGAKFAPAVPTSVLGEVIDVVDMNGDAFPDVIDVHFSSPPYNPKVFLSINLGNGTFAPPSTTTVYGNDPWMSVADVDGDGFRDLVIRDYKAKKVGISLNQGNGTFGPRVDYPVGIEMGDVVAADIDNDGQRDLLFLNKTPGSTLSMLINQGNGTFGPRIDKPMGTGEVWTFTTADIDGDGDLDLAYASSVGIKVARNQGNLNFATPTTVTVGTSITKIIAADVTGDGKPELISNDEYGSGPITVLQNHGNGSFAPPVDYIVYSTGPTNVRAVDIDGDGNVDIAFGNRQSAHITMLRNKGDGTFVMKSDIPTGFSMSTMLAVDVSGDGQPDLVQGGYHGSSNKLEVRINQGAGDFSAVAASYALSSYSSYIKAGDLNGDGLTDIVVGTASTGTIGIFLNQGGGMFAPMITLPWTNSGAIATKDLNGDGLGDMVISTSNDVKVLLNQGNVTFAEAQNIPGAGSQVLGDVNADGIDDLLLKVTVPPQSALDAVMLGIGNGHFDVASPINVNIVGGSRVLQDLDADGFPELLTLGSGVRVYHNNGDGTFTFAQSQTTSVGPTSITTGDMNRDGAVDVIVANGSSPPNEFPSQSISVYLNDGTGTLAPRIEFAGSPISIAAADLNGDGATDIAVASSSTIGLLFNTCLP